MAVHLLSRYSFTAGFDSSDASSLVTDTTDGVFMLSDREPFRYKQYSDTIAHTVSAGDTLFTLAARYYSGFTRPAGLWWVIADFQPDPIIDPTIVLSVGRLLYIPSIRTVTEDVFSAQRGKTESAL